MLRPMSEGTSEPPDLSGIRQSLQPYIKRTADNPATQVVGRPATEADDQRFRDVVGATAASAEGTPPPALPHPTAASPLATASVDQVLGAAEAAVEIHGPD